MEKAIKVLLTVCVVFGMSIPVGAAPLSVREALVASSNTDQVYAIDDFRTLVIPSSSLMTGGMMTPEFVKEFQSLCPAPLDVFETVTVEDEKTGETSKTTKLAVFTPDENNEVIKDSVGCTNSFRIVNVFGKRLNGVFRAKSFILKHDKSQKYVYKTGAIEGQVGMPPEGQVKFLKGKNDKSLMGSFNSFFGGKKYPFDGEDLMQYAQDVSKKNNLKPRYIIDNGKLKEVSAYEAFVYAYSNNTEIENKQWYFVAEGDKPFVISVKQTKNEIPESSVTLNKGVDGLKFVPLQKAADNKTPQAKVVQ